MVLFFVCFGGPSVFFCSSVLQEKGVVLIIIFYDNKFPQLESVDFFALKLRKEPLVLKSIVLSQKARENLCGFCYTFNLWVFISQASFKDIHI